MVAAGLSTTGLIGFPTLGCSVIKIATGVQVVSLGYNQLPSSINVLNGSNYDTYVRTSGAVGWVVVNQSAYLPLSGGALTGQVTTNQTPILGTQLVPKSYVDTFLPKSGGTMTGNIDMGAYGITTNQAFFAGTNFVTKTYVDNAISGGGAFLPTAGGTMTGAITMGGNAINTTQSTFTSGQLVSKNYVDTATTFVKCPTGDLGLRILRGTVGALATTSGNGWTSSYSGGANRQYIYFNPPFSNANYTVLITPVGAMTILGTKTTTEVPMYWSNFQNSVVWVPFEFIIIGS
jgi:hypothetical protein